VNPAIVVFVLAEALRPSECTSLDGGRASVVWQRVKAPELQRYCDLIASGIAKLASEPGMPDEALATAAEAEKALPGRAPAAILSGRALLRQGRASEAYASLREAKRRNERALDEPHALLAWARAAGRTGRTDEAREAYASLLPSLDSLPTFERESAYVEGGMLFLAKGPERLSQAIEALRQARREAHGDPQVVATVALALALDRAGELAEARGVIDERPLPGAAAAIDRARARRLIGPETNDPEALALAAYLVESQKSKGAREAWRRYIDALPSGPWAAHAKEHEAALAHGAKR